VGEADDQDDADVAALKKHVTRRNKAVLAAALFAAVIAAIVLFIAILLVFHPPGTESSMPVLNT
jgi:cell division protein FtsN